MVQVLAVKEQWRARRKVLKDEFMALMALPSLTPLQASRTQELAEAMDAHDASKPSSGSSRRKKKKRRRRRLPKAPLPRGGRPCALQRQVPAVQVVHVLEGAPASVHRQSAGFPCCATETWYPQCYCTEDRLVPSGTVLGQIRCARVVQRQLLHLLVQKTRGVSIGAVLGQGDMPVVILSDAFGQTSQKTADSPVSVRSGRRHLLSFRRADPHGPGFSADHGDSAVAACFGGRCPCCASHAGSQVLPWRRPWRSHSCSSLRNQTLSSALCIWQSLVRCSSVEYRILDFSGRNLPDMPYSAVPGSTVDTCLRQSSSSCFLLVAMHLALCSLACRPFVADNSGDKQLALYSLFPSSGPRCATSWPVWTRRTENSPVAPQQAPRIWQSLVLVSVINTPWFDSGYKFGVSLRGLLEKIHMFYV